MASRSGSSRLSRPKEGTRLGDWVLREEIGAGSFAYVHRAKNLVSWRPPSAESDCFRPKHHHVSTPANSRQQRGGYAAVKCVILAKLNNNKKLKENLFGEIKILKSLNHPHIVPLFDCKDSPEFIFLIMEFCSMGDLSHFIKYRRNQKAGSLAQQTLDRYPNPDHGGINEVLARNFIKQLSSAVEFLQTKNLIHRDLKPQNVLLAPSRQTSESTQAFLPDHMKELQPVGVPSLPVLKIADFGFARSLPPQGLAETLCGSPLYMAPEILRYEKYDAKADLWSVGTVTYEMVTGRPPFRAGNHVELLRNIEKCDDVIKFPSEVRVSSGVKDLIRSLLKRNPVQRTSFADFFKHPVVTGDIPGLLDEDREALETHSRPELTQSMAMARTSSAQRREEARPSRPDPVRLDTNEVFVDALEPPRKFQDHPHETTPAARPRLGQVPTAPPGRTPQLEGGRNVSEKPAMNRYQTEMPPPQAPASTTRRPDTARRHSVATRPSPPPQHQVIHRTREEQERAAQDVADEREYVVVEKKAVEMNALADELQASPRIRSHRYSVGAQQRPVRQVAGSAPVNNQISTTRTTQTGNANRPDHLRRASFERRAKTAGSASSAIAKALSMASGRLMNLGFSPPVGRAGSAPNMPIYSAFPAYPTQQSQLLLEDGNQSNLPLDDDSKTLQAIEETATRSDVVHGFAEVKFLQIAPAQPAVEQGLGVQGANVGPNDEGSDLPPEALVMVCEEALVLYVKALNLLSRAMDVAAAWWKRRNRGDATDSASVSPKSFKTGNAQAAARVNSVVQWVRNRFNETLAKAEFVSLKLVEAQKLLPSDHPCHPSHRSTSASASIAAAQAQSLPKDQANGPVDVYISPGVTAERIMYQRAVEMSRTAAVNELMGENLNDCEIGYVTAIRMLEVVLETSGIEASSESGKQEKAAAKKEIDDDDGLDPEDRESVLKSKPNSLTAQDNHMLTTRIVLQGTKNRLHTLRKKMQMLARRNSAQAVQQRSPKAKPAPLAPGNASAR